MRSSLILVLMLFTKAAVSEQPQPFQGKRALIPGKIEAEHYDLGKAEIAYHDVDPQNRGAEYRELTQVDIEKRDDASNGHGVGWTKKGEWLVYSVSIAKAGDYSLEIPVASNKLGGKFHLEVAGKDITGPVQIPDTGGWDQLKTIKVNRLSLPVGDLQLKIMMDEEGPSKSIGDFDCFIFEALN